MQERNTNDAPNLFSPVTCRIILKSGLYFPYGAAPRKTSDTYKPALPLGLMAEGATGVAPPG